MNELWEQSGSDCDHGSGRQRGLDHPVSGTLSTGGEGGGGIRVPGV